MIEATKKFIAPDGNNRIMAQYIRIDFCKAGLTAKAFAADGYRMSIENADCFEVDEDFSAYVKPQLPAIRTKESVYAIVEIVGKNCLIDISGQITGFRQPEGERYNDQVMLETLQNHPVSFRVGFNGQYLLDAVQAARASIPNWPIMPVILEFREPNDAVLLRTGKDNVKAVLPIRLKENTERMG
jgi:hypothetical protein